MAEATEHIELLKQLIAIESFSGNEQRTADLIAQYLSGAGITTQRVKNNIWAHNKYFEPRKPILLLNSHHDTVKPGLGWHNSPFEPTLQHQPEGIQLVGLGSNDAGGPLVTIIGAFLHFCNIPNLPYNLILAATAEEENSGKNGIELLLNHIPQPDLAIVAEPTQMQMAVAQKGLMVLDCVAQGKTGHAARTEGINALYLALDDINRLRNFSFEKESAVLGPVKMTTTVIHAGEKHNVVPDKCTFTVDVRTTEVYNNKQTFKIIQEQVLQNSVVTPRSTRLNPGGIATNHPLVSAGKKLGLKPFGSPTLSDLALLPCPGLKIGPGDSGRSHTPNEFIYLHEIEQGLQTYIKLLEGFFGIG